jgi:hypothetical protein
VSDKLLKPFNLLKTAQALLCLDAAIWLILGVASLLRIANNPSASRMVLLIVAVLMFGNVTAMLLAALGLSTRRKLLYLFALAVLGVNILLTFTDQFGFLDFATLLLDLLIVGMLIAAHKQFQ